MTLSFFIHDGLAGVSAAAVQITTGEVLAAMLGIASSPLRATGRWLIDVLPGRLVDVSLALLQRADKAVLLWTLVVVSLGLTGVAALAGTFAAIIVLVASGSVSLAALWRRPELPRGIALVVGTGAAVAGPASLLFLSPSIAIAVSAGALLVAAACRRARGKARRNSSWRLPQAAITLPPPGPGTHLDVPGISHLFTPTSRFYVTDVAFPAPQVDAQTWRLEVTGLVATPVSLSFADLLATESVEIDATLVCIHNPVGGHRIGTGRWQGVPVSRLLQRVGRTSGADHVLARSVDGFSGGFPLAVLGCNPIIAFGLNGELLRPEHGAPARLLVPGIYGYDANVKWLKTLELTRFALARDYWERKGWPREPARVRCQSRIDVPKHTSVLRPGAQIIAGVAWSPPNGVTKVEISADGGAWRCCVLAEELSPAAWRHWRCDWDAEEGDHELHVRAWGRDGVQEQQDFAPFPRGAAGYHRVNVVVTRANPLWGREAFRATTADLAARVRLAHAGIRAWTEDPYSPHERGHKHIPLHAKPRSTASARSLKTRSAAREDNPPSLGGSLRADRTVGAT